MDHAANIVASLLELVSRRLHELLTIFQMQGDGIIAYIESSHLHRGETLLELVESTYNAFRDRQITIARDTACTCNACRSIHTLDLKFLIHYTQYMTENVRNMPVLIGPDAILISQRLLKKNVGEKTTWRGYALFTKNALEHMGVRPEGLYEQSETYEDVGTRQSYILDLQDRYAALDQPKRTFVEKDTADYSLTISYSAAAPIVWDWLNDLDKRMLWMPGKRWTSGVRPTGRVGIGVSNCCADGWGKTIEQILDWKPFDYYTVQVRSHAVSIFSILATYQIAVVNAQTYLNCAFKLPLPLPKAMTKLLCKFFVSISGFPKSLKKMAALIEKEWQG